MPVLSLRLSERQYRDLDWRAVQNNSSVSSYVFSVLFPNDSVPPGTLTHQEILQRISSCVQSGEEFSIPSLFDEDEWNSFTNTVSIGRTFRIASKNKSSVISKAVTFVKKESGKAAVYKKN